jgi:hypothetical protein
MSHRHTQLLANLQHMRDELNKQTIGSINQFIYHGVWYHNDRPPVWVDTGEPLTEQERDEAAAELKKLLGRA